MNPNKYRQIADTLDTEGVLGEWVRQQGAAITMMTLCHIYGDLGDITAGDLEEYAETQE